MLEKINVNNFPPIAVKKNEFTDESYIYPIERLRKEITLEKLKLEDRKLTESITKKFQPRTEERLLLTEKYCNLLSLCTIFDEFSQLGTNKLIEWSSNHRDISQSSIKYNIISASSQNGTALKGIHDNGIFQRKNKKKIQKIELICHNFSDNQFRVFSRMVNYSPYGPKNKNFAKIFKLQRGIITTKIGMDELLQTTQDSDISIIKIAIILIDDTNKSTHSDLVTKLISNGIPVQRITKSVMDKLKIPPLNNIMLGIFGKAGGQPWIGNP